MVVILFLFCFVLFLIALYIIFHKPKVHIYTITNTYEKKELQDLATSIKRQGGTLNIIYTTDKIGRLPVGYGAKVMRLYEAIQDKPDDMIICFVDAFDVLFGAPVSELRDKYLAMNLGNKVLFSAEQGCWPVSHQYKDYCKEYKEKNPVPPNTYGYLNSGMFIGTVKGIKNIIEERWHTVNHDIDDQGWYGQTFLRTNRIVLDTKCELFQNLVGDQSKDLVWDEQKKRWFNKNTKTYPIVFHANGNSEQVIKI